MEPVLATLATTAVVEGIKFLYKEVSEVLSSWRKRRQDKNAPPPKVLEFPEEITIQDPHPLEEPVNQKMEDTLQELKDMAEKVKEGQIDPDSKDARNILANLREMLEVVLQTPITFRGEAPRTLQVKDINVTVENVSGKVSGVRANLEKLQGPTNIGSVDVKTKDIQPGGDVTGVDLV